MSGYTHAKPLFLLTFQRAKGGGCLISKALRPATVRLTQHEKNSQNGDEKNGQSTTQRKNKPAVNEADNICTSAGACGFVLAVISRGPHKKSDEGFSLRRYCLALLRRICPVKDLIHPAQYGFIRYLVGQHMHHFPVINLHSLFHSLALAFYLPGRWRSGALLLAHAITSLLTVAVLV